MPDQTAAPSSSRRPPAWVLVVIGLLAALVLGWLILRWVMAAPLSGVRSHDFGSVSIVEDPTWVDHVFRLKNTSGKTLTIRRAVPSCGCTETRPFEPVVPVGGELELPVRMKLDRSAREHADVTLTFENAPPMKVFVEAVGRLANPLLIEPPAVRLRPGQTRPISITMETWEDAPRPLPAIKSPESLEVKEHPWSQARVGQPVRGTPSLERTMIEITVPEGTEPMTTAVEVVLNDQVVEIPVEIAAQLKLDDTSDPSSGTDPGSTFNPVGLPGTPAEEAPDDPGSTP
ncbi:MAG: DUF1573 domain-containing protein [Phycisphaerales bacterium]|nr:DUF1573 domain-containing protein [Phycisphaerales bacterium]